MRVAAALAALSLTSAAVMAADVPFLAQPIDCTLGDSCFIQNYVDRDPGPDVRDFACGGLSYDGHKGTDFALLSLAAMEHGVAVLAAAPGTVVALRDGEPDAGLEGATEGKECGNGVVISHGDGWQTQYCHLKRGSVAVFKGQRVAAGTVLGDVGLSGRTQFPHLHLSLRRDGDVVDPFDTSPAETCATENPSLWVDPPQYRAGGLIDAGFSASVPAFDAIKTGHAAQPVLPEQSAAIVLWGYAFGGRAGDEMRFQITGPEGSFLNTRVRLEKAQAQLFRAVGRKLNDDNRVTGRYTGTVELIREGRVIDRQATALRLGR
ncbi:MAG: M23 family metallopeptidase [Brevirhabdus sp.]